MSVVLVVLTMLVCLLLSAAVAVYVAYPSRGRPLSGAMAALHVTPRRAVLPARVGRSRLPRTAETAADGARG